MPLEWTKDAPTEEGYYWLHWGGDQLHIVRVEWLSYGGYIEWPGTGDGAYLDDEHEDFYWYGPLEAPPPLERKEG